MRSIGYIMGGPPRTRYDCNDYAAEHHICRIILTLRQTQEHMPEWARIAFIGNYVWIFDDATATYDEMYGAWYYHEAARRQISADNANRRLMRDIRLIKERTGFAQIEGSDGKFELQSCH